MASQVPTDSDVRRTRRYFLHPLLALVFLVVAFVGIDLVAHLREHDDAVISDLTLIYLGVLALASIILLLEVAGAIISIVRNNLIKLVFHCLAIALLVCAAMFGKQVAFATQYINLWLFAGTYQACARSAESYGDGAAFRLCSAQGSGNAFGTIVYDSGAQIALPLKERSAAFHQFMRTRVSPILSECKASPAKKLSANFYFVQSDCDSRPGD